MDYCIKTKKKKKVQQNVYVIIVRKIELVFRWKNQYLKTAVRVCI